MQQFGVKAGAKQAILIRENANGSVCKGYCTAANYLHFFLLALFRFCIE